MQSRASRRQEKPGAAPFCPPAGSPAAVPAHAHEQQQPAADHFDAAAPDAEEVARSHERESTPDAEPVGRGQGGSSCSGDGASGCSKCGPITPDAAGQPTHALCLSPAAGAAATGEVEPEGSAPPAAALQGPAPRQPGAPAAEASGSRLRSFVCCVAAAPLLQSALLWMELSGSHPLPEGDAKGGLARGRGLQLTLAQLLALHLRSGSPTATEASLLAALWVLESARCCQRSAATVCLASYVKYLGLLAPQVVERLTADWPAAFAQLRARLVAAQAELLAQLDWRVRLDYQSDVLPCAALLFGSPAGARAPAPSPSGAGLWACDGDGQDRVCCAAAMRQVVARLTGQAQALRHAVCQAPARQRQQPTPEPAERSATGSPTPAPHPAASPGAPTKRRRVR